MEQDVFSKRLIIEGTTEKALLFNVPLWSINNKTFFRNKNIFFEHRKFKVIKYRNS